MLYSLYKTAILILISLDFVLFGEGWQTKDSIKSNEEVTVYSTFSFKNPASLLLCLIWSEMNPPPASSEGRGLSSELRSASIAKVWEYTTGQFTSNLCVFWESVIN